MPYQEQYGNHTLDTIHSFFPALLYDTGAFQTVPQVFSYVNRQMDRHFNLFSSARAAYHSQLYPANPTRTLSSVLSSALAAPSLNGPLSASLNNIGLPNPFHVPLTYNDISQTVYPSHSGISDLLSAMLGQVQAPLQATMDPVIVRPSADQISANTMIEINASEGEMCAICQDVVPVGGQVRTITICDHSFHVGCIDTWFQSNVRCPVCRHDIREDA